MGRPAKFTSDELLDSAADLLVEGGPAALTAAAVARAAGAPSGSVYHRFPSRDVLAAALWMRTVERFDHEVVSGMEAPGEPIDVAVAVATRVIDWSAEQPVDAFVLTMFRREDLVADHTFGLSERAGALGTRQRAALDALAARLALPTDLVRFAVAGIPMAAIRRYVGDRSPLPPWVRRAVERSVRATLSPDPNEDHPK